ncbi:hypothetical protein B0H17DRAFT_1203472 [Mycena rosella]|uniref:KOW domain-containing protein n=1 Tax=Mycena rosella TaxID=1033263 RepID=A0AAD7GCC5_MYCRO|nr:hypothetical protein B0H17DRAFT_1203472 [Mycena rosella]
MDDADRPLHRHAQILTWIDGEVHAAENESRGSDDEEDDAETDIRRATSAISICGNPRTICGRNAPGPRRASSAARILPPPAATQQLPLAQHSQHSRRSVSSFYFPTPDWQAGAAPRCFLPWTPERTPEPQYSQDAPVRMPPLFPEPAHRRLTRLGVTIPLPQSSPQPPAKRAHLHDADNPAVQRNEETSNAEGDEDLELTKTTWPDAHHQTPLMAPIAEEDAALLKQAGVAEMSPAATLLAHDPTIARAVQDAVDTVMPRPAPTLPPKLPGLVVPHPPIIPSGIPETAAQVARRVHRLLVSPRPRRTPAWTDESQQEKEKQPQKKRDAAQRRDHHNFVEPGTWIRLRVEDTQQHVGLLAFTVSETWCINTHPRLYPTIDEIAPFQSCTHPIFETAHFVGHFQAIQLGDRVIVYRGVHAGLAGYIIHIKDVLVKNPDSSSVQRWVTMMRISTRFPGTTRDISELPGGWVQLGQLRRHVLCPSPPLRLFDRVRIIGNRDAMFLPFGYVTNIADAEEHAARVAVEKENGTSALVPLHNVEHCFEEGDRVVVRRGPEQNRQGIVVARHLFVLEIFDGAACMLENMAEMTTTDALMQCHTFFDRVPDVNFAMFNEYSAVYPNECSHSVVPQLNAPLPVAQLSPDARRAADRQAREDDARAASDEKTALQAALQTLNAIAPPETLQHLQDRISYFKNGLKKMVKDRQDLIKGVGRRYEGLQVVVVGAKKKMDTFDGLRKGSVWKGHRGIVVGDLDSPERAARLSEQMLKKRWYMRADTRGIMVTVKEQDGRHFTEKIEKLVHEVTGLRLAQAQYLPPTILSSYKLATPQLRPRTPTPPPNEASDWTLPDVPSDYESHRIPRESNGEWLCDPSLTDKRVDVVLRGIGRMGSTGYLLLEEAITPTSLQSRKITVYGVGKTLRKHDVPGQYIQPLPTDVPSS